ncbi:TGN-related, localized SYP41 interacting protein [Arabidopsis thaliana]|uniref:TGN-related, localized SYP41 interacting protein n=1 Tax=Arabidopsis thaliana TaxID=3702 RepID=UPI0001E92BA6|nr:TGN-related, localized SYP41 interacting protein [Arabidopsis thaliana]AEE30533.1 TGN-related, localized SYP41 interacting protein [Arabidopsis thaliana]|eukprot:NP_001185085.1 TGN-related, localized SYP41 interacting protein [Arabidopsis thaliana]
MHEKDDLPQDSIADGIENDDESNGQEEEELDPDQGTAFVDSKEDMFVDAPEELNFDTPSKEALTTDDDDNDDLGTHFNIEKGDWEKELAGLQEQFKLLTGENDLTGEDGNTTVDIVSRFSKFLKTAKEERIQHEVALKELHGVISGRDDEIADLTTKISELSSSQPVSEMGDQAQNLEHLEAATDRIMVSLSNVFGEGELQYGSSISEKLAHLENRVSFLGAKYTEFYYGADQLRKCLASDVLDLSFQEDFGSALGAACSELFELKQKEAAFFERLSHLEDENRNFVEQVNREKEMCESMRTEFEKLKAELELEKTKCTNTKEKLSMAVTKGKALVQNRDALKHQLSEKTTELANRLTELQEKEIALESSEVMKGQLEQSLTEKTDELEKCYAELNDRSVSLEAYELTKKELEQSLAEKTKELEECLTKLQEMSTALDQSELDKGELAKSDAMVASYQEMLSVRNSIIENIETILSNIYTPEEGHSFDIVEKVRSLAEERKELTNVSQEYNRLKDLIVSIDLPEEMSQSSLESRLAWLRESFLQGKDEVNALQNRIESVSMSLSAEMEEKSNIRKELDDLSFSLKKMEETAERGSLEREEIVRRLVETSGLMTEGVEDHTSSDINLLVDRSFDKIEKQIRDSSDSSYGNEEIFEAFQSLLYVRDLEFSLCKEMLGEGELISFQVSNLSDELKIASQELAFVKEEKIALEKDLERSEEKSALLRDKLSMAIKKGKGLVQDREKFKTQLDEKKSEIEKLMLELQQLGGTVDGYKNQIDMLSRDLERTKELETELVATKEERDQLQQSLSLIDTLLQKVMKSVEIIALPVDLASEDPSEKIDRLAGYIQEVQLARVEEQEEIEKVKSEVDALTSKLAETQTALKLVEDALSTAEDNISRLTEENRNVQAAKENAELELQKAVADASSVASELDEVLATKSTLEAALMQAERNISDIISEKEEAQGRTATAEMEQEMLQKEASIQKNKLTEAHSTINSLEETLAQTESNMDSLSKQIEDDKVLTTSLKNELEKLKIEAEFERNKMAEASLTIVSHEEALMKAENSLSALQGEMVKAEGEISTLSSKLNVCMEELAGSSGNSQSKSLEIITHLDNLQMLLKDGGLISKVNEFLQRKFKSLRDVDVIARDITRNIGENGLLAGEMGNAEDDSTEAKSLLSDLDNSVNTEPENSQGSAADEDEISSSLRKMAEGVRLRNKTLENNFEGFSTSIDTLIATLMQNMTAARADVLNIVGHNSSLEEQVRSVENIVREQENTISALQKDLSSLISACGAAARELQLEVKNNLLELVQFQENENGGEMESTEDPQELHVSECAQRIKELSSAAEKACATLKLFETTNNAAATVIRDMENRLTEASVALEKAVVKEEKWHEKEVELSTLYDKLLVQEQEAKENLIPASDMRTLFDKINGIEVPSVDLVNGLDPQSPYDVKKLFAIVDSVTEMQHQIDILSYGQKELNSTLAEKDLEIQGLKKATEAESTTELELVKAKNELSKLISGLEKLLGILASNNPVVDPNFSESWTLVQALEKKITSLLLESESSKSRAQELGLKLAGSEKLVDKLSLRVKEFEEKLQTKAIQPDIVQERSIFETPRAPSTSEISEIEDKGALGIKSISPVPTAAQVRTVRKGSTDHLSINIDSESEHLMNNNETDEDKGHVFKSLNMSGLIPTQGKIIADRVDGIWVSGGRVLMSRPQARLGVMVYSLLLHLWLLASIL